MAKSFPPLRRRPATTRDLHRLTVISTTSLIDDATYDYMYPYRGRFPEDNFTWFQLRLQKLLYDKRTTFLVIEIDGDGSKVESYPYQGEPNGAQEAPNSTIISYAVWIRMGCDAAAKQRMKEKNTWMNMLDGGSTHIYHSCRFATVYWSLISTLLSASIVAHLLYYNPFGESYWRLMMLTYP
jgi:hypothetical protein